MLPPASVTEMANIADPVFRLTMMRDCVRAVRNAENLHFPLLNLVSTFIDGLVSAPKRRSKIEYSIYLRQHFPDLCAAIDADIFYENYRCKAVHFFGLGTGYGIGRDDGMHGKYVDTQTILETGEALTVLNVDRLVDDFLSHVEKELLAANNARRQD